jgi:hypothetical protein
MQTFAATLPLSLRAHAAQRIAAVSSKEHLVTLSPFAKDNEGSHTVHAEHFIRVILIDKEITTT